MTREQLTITIDGPTASGKSSSATALAGSLNILHLKGSSFLRAATLLCLRSNVIEHGSSSIASTVKNAEIGLLFRSNTAYSILLDGEQVDDSLNSREVDRVISTVSQIPEVRKLWIDWLRSFSVGQSLVIDGRSMGSEVFPEAGMKFWLQARAEIRAKRRAIDYGTQDVNVVLRDLLKRDRQDREDGVARLIVPPAAVRIDSSELSGPQVTGVMLEALRAKGLLNSGAL